jgi:hypothetical protein
VVVALLPAVGAAPEVADSVTRRGSRLSSTWRCFWGMSSTVVGAPCIPLPPTLSGLKTCNATAGCLVRSGRCFTQLRSPAMKVVAAAKIAATSSVVVNVVLVVPLFAAGHGGAQRARNRLRHPSSPRPGALGVGLPPGTPKTCRGAAFFYCSSAPSVEGDSFSVAFEDAYLELSEEDSLPTSEIWLHIAINVVSRLNVMEEFRSLSAEELSLREFLLDQLLLLQDSLEPCLVPRVVKDLLGTKLVAPPVEL